MWGGGEGSQTKAGQRVKDLTVEREGDLRTQPENKKAMRSLPIGKETREGPGKEKTTRRTLGGCSRQVKKDGHPKGVLRDGRPESASALHNRGKEKK